MYPVLFVIPIINVPIYSYGAMLGLSFIVGWHIIMYLGKKDGIAQNTLASVFLWAAASALLGSRILYIVTNPDQFQGSGLKEMFNMRSGGLVAYGGFLGGFVGSWIYLRIKRIRLLPWADVVAPALGSGLGITRIGCFLYGCDHGKPIPAEAPGWVQALGMRFPNWKVVFADSVERFKDSSLGCAPPLQGSPAFNLHAYDLHLVKPDAAYSALVYPTQLMEVANGWLAFGLAMLVRKHQTFRGQVFLSFTAYYGITRTLMEFLRGDTQRGGIGLMSTSQIIGMATFLASVAAWIVLGRRAKCNPEAAMAMGDGIAAEKPKPEKDDPTVKVKTKSRKKKKK